VQSIFKKSLGTEILVLLQTVLIELVVRLPIAGKAFI